MSLSVKTTLYPYRMHLKEKEPMELVIEIKNEDIKPKLVSFELQLPEAVAIDRTGMTRLVKKNLEKMGSGETKKLEYNIYPTKTAESGSYSGKILVLEHYQDYDYVLGKYSKEVLFRIIE